MNRIQFGGALLVLSRPGYTPARVLARDARARGQDSFGYDNVVPDPELFPGARRQAVGVVLTEQDALPSFYLEKLQDSLGPTLENVNTGSLNPDQQFAFRQIRHQIERAKRSLETLSNGLQDLAYLKAQIHSGQS